MPTFLALAALLPWGAAQAARPMVTDDARIVDAKACQVESWVKRNQDSTEYWAQPACNFTGNLELSLGGAKGKDDGGTQTTDIVLQAKTLFKPLEPDGWGWGLAVGNVRHPAIHTGNNLLGDLYAYVPATFSLRNDRVLVHTNVGWLHEREAQRHRMTWGLGTEAQWSASTWLIAEVFGQNQGKPFYQVGLRYWLVPDHVQVDTTYGNRAGSGAQERWFSIGLRLLSPAFLP
ncbi:MAG: hypothetical protein ABT02_06835 [Comamonadaceae bacterium SCN 68-20]|nr:MAG: hypothetical protein ABT02_06835 [Comamonadaceae bacterium SCN 68-20]OJX30783.1 MAG: hypothetical protein BGO75_19470 [Burkholderiales bacterium 68-20]